MRKYEKSYKGIVTALITFMLAITCFMYSGKQIALGEEMYEEEYILPESNVRVLSAVELAGLDSAELRLARNEIFARHGRKFQSEDLMEYFSGKSWYKGTIEPNEFNESEILSDVEYANLRLILLVEDGSVVVSNIESEPSTECELEMEAEIDYSDIPDTDIAEYLTDWMRLVDVLKMRLVKKDMIGWEEYKSNEFVLTSSGRFFSMADEGCSYVNLYGIKMGDHAKKIDQILQENGWRVASITDYSDANGEYDPSYNHGPTGISYGNIINGQEYLLICEMDEANCIVYWYMNNWPEGEGSTKVYEQIRRERGMEITEEVNETFLPEMPEFIKLSSLMAELRLFGTPYQELEGGMEEVFEAENVMLRRKIPDINWDGEYIVKSVSPDGKRILCIGLNQSETSVHAFIASLEDDEIIEVWMDYENSIGNACGELDEDDFWGTFQLGKSNRDNLGTCRWSSDGKYIIIENYYDRYYDRIMAENLVMISTETGAWTVLDTNTEEEKSDWHPYVYGMCFSNDNSKIYYLQNDFANNKNMLLKQYDIVEGKSSVLAVVGTGEEYLIPEGGIFCTESDELAFAGSLAIDDKRYYQIFVYDQDENGIWKPISKERIDAEEGETVVLKQFCLDKKGRGVLIWTCRSDDALEWMMALADINSPEIFNTRIITEESLERNELVMVSMDEEEKWKGSWKEMQILPAAIHPDGEYALLCFYNKDYEISVRLINLSTCEWKSVLVKEGELRYMGWYGGILSNVLHWYGKNQFFVDDSARGRVFELVVGNEEQ